MGECEVFGSISFSGGALKRIKKLWEPRSCKDCAFLETFPWCVYYRRHIYDEYRKPDFCRVRTIALEEDRELE